MPALPLERYNFMDDKQIRKYAELMREMGLSALEINEETSTVRMEMGSLGNLQGVPIPAVSAIAPTPAPAIEAEDEAQELGEVCSPMVGVFYAAPAENVDPFVKIGDKVKKGDVLCIIEAMKLMNEIAAEENGTIMDICVGNNQVVDFGHVLFRIRKD